MTRFEQVKDILEQSVNGQTIGAHGNFWRNTTRDEFVAKRPFGRPLLIVGDGAGSNLVKAPPAGAIFSRMPAGFPPVPPEKIEFIRQWINDGCPAADPPAAQTPVDMTGGGPIEGLNHNALWREFDRWAMFEATPETQAAIGEFFAVTQLWQDFSRDPSAEATWQAAIVVPATRSAIELLAANQLKTFRDALGTPIPLLTLLDSFERFGDNSLPDDPVRPPDRRHNMNGLGMWGIWMSFVDACLRLTGETAFWNAMARGVLMGMLNDGLFRGRLTVVGFTADLAGKVALRAHLNTLPDSALAAEMRQRFVDSGVGA
jgi:hypothetical protein